MNSNKNNNFYLEEKRPPIRTTREEKRIKLKLVLETLIKKTEELNKIKPKDRKRLDDNQKTVFDSDSEIYSDID